ncbi:MAG: AHH domain-containing protein [Tenuifilaceae bacterium]|nr:AHH domain-containing protein [Tenuifilaceae bacterium]
MIASEIISNQFKKSPDVSIEQKVDNALPDQMHHYATNKNKVFTGEMASIAESFGLDLDGDWNKDLMSHLGRHPNKYHQFVLQGMQRAAGEAGGDPSKFVDLFDIYVKQVVKNNPLMLRKIWWTF